MCATRYSITESCTKYVEVGVNPGATSFIEVILGDCHGHQLQISQTEWRKLVQKADIVECDDPIPSDCAISERLNVKFPKLYGETMVKFECDNVYIIITIATFKYLISLDLCIEALFSELEQKLETISIKYHQFSSIKYTTPKQADVSHIICNSGYFKYQNIIDCELLIYLKSRKY